MRWVWWVVVVVALLAGCAEKAPRLAVAPDSLELSPGEEQTLTAQLNGFSGEVVWSAKYGVIIGKGLEVVYRAPDYPIEDVITAVSQDDPRLRAEARVVVSSGGELGPRIEIAGDLALVFTQIGEKRRLEARLYDAAGKLVPDGRPVFSSADPESFSIDYDEQGNAVVTARSDKIQSAVLTARYQGFEARAVAVFARLQPGVRRLAADSLLSGNWRDGGWSSLTLKRTPETETLKPGTVFYSGDAEALWGRIDAIELAEDAITLITAPARIEEVFRDLDYQASTPPLQIEASWREGGQLVGGGGSLRKSRLAVCEGLEASLKGDEHLTASATVRLLIKAGEIKEGRLRFNLRDTFSSAAALRLMGRQAGCDLVGWRARGGRLSMLLARLEITLESSLGVFTNDAEAELELPAAALNTQTSVVLNYQNGVWVPAHQSEQRAQPPEGAPKVEGAANYVEAGLIRRFGIGLRWLLAGKDTQLKEVNNETRLFWKLRLGGEAEAQDVPHVGPTWELVWQTKSADRLDDLQSEVLARNPQVWLETGSGHAGRLDLGSLADDQAVRFSFGSTPPLKGEASVFIEGGACAEAADCFNGAWRFLGRAEVPDSQLVWRPNKDDRGVYRVAASLSADDFSNNYPYLTEQRSVIVTSPDLSELPLELTLLGTQHGPAVGVLTYFNRPLWGSTPEGERVQLTSPLQVWVPANRMSADPASAVTPAGHWGYQQVASRCPRGGQPTKQKLSVFSNDPEMSKIILPVRLRCDAQKLPRPSLSGKPATGAAPLLVRLGIVVADAGEQTWCRLDFGDGSRPLEWAAGNCPRETTIVHAYERPGSYTPVLLVGDTAGARVLARSLVEVK